MPNTSRWPENDILKFVKIYKRHRLLWDTSLSGYINSNERVIAYKSIIEEMNLTREMTVEDVRSKIKNLRTLYLQIQKKRVNMGEQGINYRVGIEWIEEMKDIMDPCDQKLNINFILPHWPEKDLVKFVQLYKKYRVLWDSTLPEYSKSHERDNAYRAIIEEMNFSSETTSNEVKLKIRNLRSWYYREKKRLINTSEMGPRWVQEMKDVMDPCIQIPPFHNKLSNWPERDLLKFVQVYRKHRILWDASTPGYRDRYERLAAYRSLSKQMDFAKNITIKEVKNKIRDLRCWYCKKHRSQTKRDNQGIPSKATVKWFHELKDVMVGRLQKVAVGRGDDDDEDDDDDDVIICNDDDDNMIICSDDDDDANDDRVTFANQKLNEKVQTENSIDSITKEDMCFTVIKKEKMLHQDEDVLKKSKPNINYIKFEIRPTEDTSLNENTSSNVNNINGYSDNNSGMIMKEEPAKSLIEIEISGKSIINDDTSLTVTKEEPVNRNMFSDGCLEPLPKEKQNIMHIKLETTPSGNTSSNDNVDEFQIFANNLAEQLITFPLPVALILQMEIQAMIENKHMEMFGK